MSLPSDVSAELFRAIAEFTYDWESWVDESGTTRWINGAVQRISGYSVAECLSRADYPLFLAYEADRAILSSVLDDAALGGSGNDIEFRIVTKGGSVRWVAISWQAVRSSQGADLGYRTSVRDIDHRKRMEDELHNIRRRAESLAMARSELLANVSHELRSPAHCIAGFAELLMQETQLPPAQRRYLELICDQARSMLRQAEDLLSLTALEAGGVELERAPFDLVALCDAAIEGSAAQARARGLTLHCELRSDARWLEGDALRIKQIVRNLLDNALKFTARGSVRLVAEDAGLHGAWALSLEVIDTGRGMAPDQVDTLRLPFKQAEPSAGARRGGVGLGLAIVERLVQAMGGKLTIDSALGEGTRVRVCLPLARLQAPLLAPSSGAAQLQLFRGHALVVDDSAPARELLSGMLRLAGYTCREADSAEAAKQALSEAQFDVVFLDYQMPDSDGAETALALRRTLKAQAGGRHVPIYILTANVFVHEQLHGARSAVDGILTKPLSRAALTQVLRQVAGQQAGSAPSPVDEDDLIDRELVHELCSMRARSGETMLAKLLPQVEGDMEHSLAKLRAALAQGARDEARRYAHAAAGHAAVVGALTARDEARELELLLHDQGPEPEAVEDALSAITSGWQAALQALRKRVTA